MDGLKFLGEQVIKRKLQLSNEINRLMEKGYIEELAKTDAGLDEITEWRARLIEHLGEGLAAGSKEAVWEKVTEWSLLTGQAAVAQGVPLDESLKTLTFYRTLIWKLIEEHLVDWDFSREAILKAGQIIDPLLDHTAYIFSTSYVDYHKKSIDLAQRAILDISVPVVALSDEIAILPLIGELDTYRAKVLMENSLQRCVELGNSELIIDLSGVPIVDTMVAHELFQVAKALKMIGVTATFSGIRPDIAQAVVQLGIDFKEVKISGNLKQAIGSLVKNKDADN